MRKIITKEELAAKTRRNQFLLGGALIIIMIISTAGYSWLDGNNKNSENKQTEKGIDFVRQNEMWSAQIGGQNFLFTYLPSEVENISVNGSFNLANYSRQVVYFNSIGIGATEVLDNLGSFILRYQQACTENCTDFPVKSCNSNFIIFENSDETKVYKNQSCVYIAGDEQKGADAFLYKILGIN